MTAETVLAFDFGEKRIGVAIGNTLTREARPLAILRSVTPAQRFEQIAQLLKEWAPERLVVGIARSAEGQDGPMTKRCERFANQLEGRYRVPVERVDERYSSVAAEALRRELRGLNLRKASSGVDDLAAQIILQSYFEAENAKPA